MAIGEVNRQILAAPILGGGVPHQSTDQLIAGHDVGNHIGSRPSLTQRGPGPAVSGARIDRLQVPVPGLTEPARLCFHLPYLTSPPSAFSPYPAPPSLPPRP